MTFFPLTQFKNSRQIRLIATDMDGTLTKNEKFSPQLLKALETLAKIPIPVLIITGRSAGWVEGLYHYLPIIGAIAENGGVFYGNNSDYPQILTPIGEIRQHRQYLSQVFDDLCQVYPKLKESSDNQYRLTDWTFSVKGLITEEIQHLKRLTEEKGLSFTYSTVQCHLKPLQQDKAMGLKQVLDQFFPNYLLNQVLTLGDSPNDDPLFNPAIFPVSVGVANLLIYRDQLVYHPTYVTQRGEVDGFLEVVSLFSKKL
ncbi:MAG: HAD-IIB family hydrolase [Microcystaceae cyanobacterium]